MRNLESVHNKSKTRKICWNLHYKNMLKYSLELNLYFIFCIFLNFQYAKCWSQQNFRAVYISSFRWSGGGERGSNLPSFARLLDSRKVDRIRVDMIGQNGLIEASLFYKIHCPAGIYMLNDVVLMSLLVTLNIFHTLLYCFYC